MKLLRRLGRKKSNNVYISYLLLLAQPHKKRSNMPAPRYLKVTLILMALYAAFMGTLTLFFHGAAALVFQYSIKDPLVMRYWGTLFFALAVLYFLISKDPVKYGVFLWVGVVDLGFNFVLTIINMSFQIVNWIQIIIPLIINPIFIVILLYGLAKEHEGEVVLVSGEESKGTRDHIPEHVRDKHPLHGK
jgi:hypothetical protein